MAYVLTAISRESLDASQFLEFKLFIESLPIIINKIVTLSPNKAYDFQVSLKCSENNNGTDYLFEKIRRAIRSDDFELKNEINLVFQKNDEFRKHKKLFCFDMDSTLIYQEVIELIAEYANVEDQVEAITTRAMNGELDFKESLRERVKLLRGIDASIWDELKLKLKFTKGVRELVRGLAKTGVKLAVLSGGFQELASYVKDQLSLDYAYANHLGTETDANGKQVFNGETTGYIVDGVKKAELTVEIAQEENINLKATVCVGDGSNDLPMMAAAGFGIAWNAKPKVQKTAPAVLNSDTMLDVFYILGYTESEIKELIE